MWPTICRVSLQCLQTPEINLLALFSSFLQEIEISAILSIIAATKPCSKANWGNYRAAPREQVQSDKLPGWTLRALYCHLRNSAQDPSQKEFRRWTFTEKQIMGKNRFVISHLSQSVFLACNHIFSFRIVTLGWLPESEKSVLSFSYKVTRSRFFCFFIWGPNICTFLISSNKSKYSFAWHGGTCLPSQHSGDRARDRWPTNPRPASST